MCLGLGLYFCSTLFYHVDFLPVKSSPPPPLPPSSPFNHPCSSKMVILQGLGLVQAATTDIFLNSTEAPVGYLDTTEVGEKNRRKEK